MNRVKLNIEGHILRESQEAFCEPRGLAVPRFQSVTSKRNLPLKPSFQLRQGLDPRQAAIPVGSCRIEEDGLHPRVASPQIVDRVDITDIEALGRLRLHLPQRG